MESKICRITGDWPTMLSKPYWLRTLRRRVSRSLRSASLSRWAWPTSRTVWAMRLATISMKRVRTGNPSMSEAQGCAASTPIGSWSIPGIGTQMKGSEYSNRLRRSRKRGSSATRGTTTGWR